MRVLFVNPPAPSGFQAWHPPLGLASISAYIKQQDKSIQTLCADMAIGQALIPAVKQFQPDIIGVTATTLQFMNAKAIGEKLRRNGYTKTLVLGGAHISGLPACLPNEYNACVVGEGERAFMNLIELTSESGIRYIPTIASAPPIENLDELPIPDRSIFDMKEYTRPDREQWIHRTGRGTSMFTSRGCLYNCVFCSSTRFWGKPVRYRSAENVVAEMQMLEETYQLEYINIFDDLFQYPKQRLKRISELYVEKGLKVKSAIQAHAPTFDEETARYCRAMNIDYVGFGLEHMNPKLLDWLKCGVAKPEHAYRAVKLAKSLGMQVGSGFMVGVPDETPSDPLLNEQFAKEVGLDSWQHYILSPYPGTPLWDMALAKGLVSVDMDFTRIFQNPTGRNIKLTEGK